MQSVRNKNFLVLVGYILLAPLHVVLHRAIADTLSLDGACVATIGLHDENGWERVPDGVGLPFRPVEEPFDHHSVRLIRVASEEGAQVLFGLEPCDRVVTVPQKGIYVLPNEILCQRVIRYDRRTVNFTY